MTSNNITANGINIEKINIATEKIENYKVASPCNHCYQISIIVGDGPGILNITRCFPFIKARTPCTFLH